MKRMNYQQQWRIEGKYLSGIKTAAGQVMKGAMLVEFV